jgi:hypothetical protein
MIGQVLSHIFAGDDYGVRIFGVVANLAFLLLIWSLSWRLRHQHKDHGERGGNESEKIRTEGNDFFHGINEM